MIIKRLAIGLFATALAASAAAQDSRIDELRAMSSEQRNTVLRAMSAEDRRGLWFELKKAQFEDREKVGSGERRDLPAASRNAASRAVGTISYDDGVPMFTVPNSTGRLIGNLFDTHDGGVQISASGNVSSVSAVVAPGASFGGGNRGTFIPSAGFVMHGPQTGGGGALALFSTFQQLSGSATTTVVFSGLSVDYSGNSFFVLFGNFDSSWVPALGTGTTAGQGHHARNGITGGMGPNITATSILSGSTNALVRATGNILPVELIDYGVE